MPHAVTACLVQLWPQWSRRIQRKTTVLRGIWEIVTFWNDLTFPSSDGQRRRSSGSPSNRLPVPATLVESTADFALMSWIITAWRHPLRVTSLNYVSSILSHLSSPADVFYELTLEICMLTSVSMFTIKLETRKWTSVAMFVMQPGIKLKYGSLWQ